MNLSKRAKVTRVSDRETPDTTEINSSSIDMTGFAGAEFLVILGAITAGAVTSLKIEGSSDDSTWSDLEGTAQTIADDDDDQVYIADIANSQHRYLRCTVERATQNAGVEAILALQYNADYEPVTHDSTTVGGSEFHHAPASGTA